MSETITLETVNAPEALRQECRSALIKGIEGYMPFILADQTEMEDLRVLRDILDFAHTSNNSILTGVAHALGRGSEEKAADGKSPEAAVEGDEQTAAIEAELRASLKEAINDQLNSFFEDAIGPTTRDLMVLRDVLIWANSNAQNILTGFGITMGRVKSDAVWVHPHNCNQVEAYAKQLDGASTELAAIMERITSVDPEDLEYVETVLNVLESYAKGSLPDEEFITEILLAHQHAKITPDLIQVKLVKYRENLAAMAQDSARFIARHPELVTAAAN